MIFLIHNRAEQLRHVVALQRSVSGLFAQVAVYMEAVAAPGRSIAAPFSHAAVLLRIPNELFSHVAVAFLRVAARFPDQHTCLLTSRRLRTEKTRRFDQLTSLQPEKTRRFNQLTNLRTEKTRRFDQLTNLQPEKTRRFDQLTNLRTEKTRRFDQLTSLQPEKTRC